ncbi:MAG TPA: glycosyltransferase family 2 protein [Candidatus Limnocylindrales bacterium]|nr:glycosyltransferase family 2 protein [Candidatus Limnocylindrales bacterium]
MYKLNIILPVYNEKDTIETVLKEWQQMLKQQKLSFSFVICEDGSTDGTKELLKKLGKKFPIILSQKQKRRGYGGAVIDGIVAAKSEYILCIDSDGQCDPKDFTKFWDKKHKAPILIGHRTNRADPLQRKLFSKAFKQLFTFLFPNNIHDPSAPFVLFKKATVHPHIPYLRFLKEGFWWGFIGMCVKKNIAVHELPINHRERLNGSTQVYKSNKIFDIALRNILGLYKLRRAQ